MAATIFYEFSGGTGNYTAELVSGTTTVVDSQTHINAGAYNFTGVTDGTYDIRIRDVNNCLIQSLSIVVNCNITTTTTTLPPGTTTTTTTTTSTTTTLPIVNLSWVLSGITDSGIGSSSPSRVYYWNLSADTALLGGQEIALTINYTLDNIGNSATVAVAEYSLSTGTTTGDIIGSGNVINDATFKNTSKSDVTNLTLTDTVTDIRLGLAVQIDGATGVVSSEALIDSIVAVGTGVVVIGPAGPQPQVFVQTT